MPNIAYFEVPADDVDRAKRFYRSLPGRRIEPGPEAVAAHHSDIVTGDAEGGGGLGTGGLYRRKPAELPRAGSPHLPGQVPYTRPASNTYEKGRGLAPFLPEQC
jgi:catechol 2,3-dioxygenase-like lactoylglutathione lyase family enzyme